MCGHRLGIAELHLGRLELSLILAVRSQRLASGESPAVSRRRPSEEKLRLTDRVVEPGLIQCVSCPVFASQTQTELDCVRVAARRSGTRRARGSRPRTPGCSGTWNAAGDPGEEVRLEDEPVAIRVAAGSDEPAAVRRGVGGRREDEAVVVDEGPGGPAPRQPRQVRSLRSQTWAWRSSVSIRR